MWEFCLNFNKARRLCMVIRRFCKVRRLYCLLSMNVSRLITLILIALLKIVTLLIRSVSSVLILIVLVRWAMLQVLKVRYGTIWVFWQIAVILLSVVMRRVLVVVRKVDADFRMSVWSVYFHKFSCWLIILQGLVYQLVKLFLKVAKEKNNNGCLNNIPTVRV